MRRLNAVLAFALASTLVACGGDSTGPSDDYSGTYTLRTIDGHDLPFVIIQFGTATIEAMSGVLTVTDNGSNGGTFSLQGTLRVTDGDQVSTESYSNPGTYTRSGTAGVFTSTADGLIGSGSIGGGKVTFHDDSFLYVFQKQGSR